MILRWIAQHLDLAMVLVAVGRSGLSRSDVSERLTWTSCLFLPEGARHVVGEGLRQI